jgi:hypothetical protein
MSFNNKLKTRIMSAILEEIKDWAFEHVEWHSLDWLFAKLEELKLHLNTDSGHVIELLKVKRLILNQDNVVQDEHVSLKPTLNDFPCSRINYNFQ